MRTFSLRNLKQRDLALAVVVLTVLGAALWWFYLYQPAQERIASLELEIGQLDMDIARGEAARRNLPALREAVAELERDRLEFLAQLPRESEVAELIVQLQDAASRSQVGLQGLNRSGNPNSDVIGVRPIDFSLSASGSYFELMTFLQELEALRRFTKIEQVGLSLISDDSTNPNLSSNIAFTAYVFTGEDPGGEP
jgi:Tfp pilus assembly protein PilO